MVISSLHNICRRLAMCCKIQDQARPHIVEDDGTDLHQAMTRAEAKRVMINLDIVGPHLQQLIDDEGTMDQRIGLLLALYMFEIRKVDWSSLCLHAHVWDQIKRTMQCNRAVYYNENGFGGDSLAHNIVSLHNLLQASRLDRKTFTNSFLMFKLSIV